VPSAPRGSKISVAPQRLAPPRGTQCILSYVIPTGRNMAPGTAIWCILNHADWSTSSGPESGFVMCQFCRELTVCKRGHSGCARGDAARSVGGRGVGGVCICGVG
jgi:hypothetical protein